MANGIVFKFDASHHAVVNLLGVDTMSSPTITPVEVAKARCQTCSSMLCLLCDRFAQIPTPKAAAQHLQPCRCIASSAMNRLGQGRKLFYTHDAA